MNYGMSRTINRPFDEVNAEVRASLTEQSFGIVSEIDMQATLHNKINVNIEPMIILGACNQKLPIEPFRLTQQSACSFHATS